MSVRIAGDDSKTGSGRIPSGRRGPRVIKFNGDTVHCPHRCGRADRRCASVSTASAGRWAVNGRGSRRANRVPSGVVNERTRSSRGCERGRSRWRKARRQVGALVGAAAGAVLAVIQSSKTSGDTGYPAGAPRPKSNPGIAFALFIPGGALVGALVGAAIGKN